MVGFLEQGPLFRGSHRISRRAYPNTHLTNQIAKKSSPLPVLEQREPSCRGAGGACYVPTSYPLRGCNVYDAVPIGSRADAGTKTGNWLGGTSWASRSGCRSRARCWRPARRSRKKDLNERDRPVPRIGMGGVKNGYAWVPQPDITAATPFLHGPPDGPFSTIVPWFR